jgi:elongation factor 1 alpha-like protein
MCDLVLIDFFPYFRNVESFKRIFCNVYFISGHVDAGKSTLIGHVLYLLGDVSKKTMHKYPLNII